MSDFENNGYKVFDLFRKQWAVVAAGNMEKFNACTVSWEASEHCGQDQDILALLLQYIFIQPDIPVNWSQKMRILRLAFFRRITKKPWQFLERGLEEMKIRLPYQD